MPLHLPPLQSDSCRLSLARRSRRYATAVQSILEVCTTVLLLAICKILMHVRYVVICRTDASPGLVTLRCDIETALPLRPEFVQSASLIPKLSDIGPQVHIPSCEMAALVCPSWSCLHPSSSSNATQCRKTCSGDVEGTCLQARNRWLRIQYSPVHVQCRLAALPLLH